MYKEKPDVKCYDCNKKYSLKELQNNEYITYKDDSYICWVCPCCGCENFVYKEHGIKSHLVDI